MREFVERLRHIFEVFEGEHNVLDYWWSRLLHTLLHVMFNPGPIAVSPHPDRLGGVGPH